MPDQESWTAKEFYRDVRELIKHEDNVISQRITAMLSIQTLLFVGMAAFIKDDVNDSHRLLIAIFGLVVTLGFWRELYYSNKAFNSAVDSWDRQKSIFHTTNAPPIIGAADEKIPPASLILAPAIVAIWLYVLAQHLNSSFEGLLGLCGLLGLMGLSRPGNED